MGFEGSFEYIQGVPGEGGAATMKALHPKVLSFAEGSTRWSLLEDLRVLGGVWWWRRWERCWGARPRRAL